VPSRLCGLLQFYVVTAVELLVNIWKYDKMASSHIVSRNWRYKASATDSLVAGAKKLVNNVFGK